MSDAANTTSTDNNGDSGLNGKLNLKDQSVSVFSLKVHNCVFIINTQRGFNH